MQTDVVVTYPEAKPASTSKQFRLQERHHRRDSRRLLASRRPRKQTCASWSMAWAMDVAERVQQSSTHINKAEVKTSATPKTSQHVTTSVKTSSSVPRSSSESTSTARTNTGSSAHSESSSAGSSTSNSLPLTSTTSTTSVTSASGTSEPESSASAIVSETVSSAAVQNSTMQAGTTQEVASQSNDASQSSSTWARPIGTSTIIQSMAEVPGKVSATVVTYTGLQGGRLSPPVEMTMY